MRKITTPATLNRRHLTEQGVTAERRFQRVVEAAPSAMVMTNQAGKIVMVNAQAERVFGYLRDELLGHPVEMLVPERFRGHHPGLRQAFLIDPRPRPMGAGRRANVRLHGRGDDRALDLCGAVGNPRHVIGRAGRFRRWCVPPGATLEVRAGPGPKGPQVTEILSVD